jgi:phosphatidylglycerol:prolipoprotein diacylglycerol transferase
VITIDIDPVLIGLGHFALRWYGLIVAASIGLGAWVASREARRKGLPPEVFQDALLWGIVGGLVGARVFHVIDHWPHEYAADPLRVLYFWQGGLAIWGGVIGGVTALALFARRRHLSLGRLADIAVPGLVLAQATGRLACVITGDAMGPPTNGPFGIAYTNPAAMVPQLGVYYTPMPVFELIANLAIFAVVWGLRRRSGVDGNLFLIYLMLYGVERFTLAFASSYQVVAFGLTQSQIIALATLAVSVPLGIWALLQKRRVRLA